jgi:hypothetical protein
LLFRDWLRRGFHVDTFDNEAAGGVGKAGENSAEFRR